MNAGVLRTWNLPIRGPDETPKPWHYVLAPGQFSDEAFKVMIGNSSEDPRLLSRFELLEQP